MAINIHHTYSTYADIKYDPNPGFYEFLYGTMDELSQHACEVIVKNNLTHADICSAETGELLMVVERT